MIRTNKKSSAFTLIELSVVLVVIGIFVLGISQCSRLVSQARIKTAIQMTESSPAASIGGMLLWLETTNGDNLKTSTRSAISAADFGNVEDEDLVSAWKTINSQDFLKLEARVMEDDDRPTYKTDGINNLPTLSFDGSGDELSLVNAGSNNNSVLNIPNTIFVVGQINDTSNSLQYFIGRQSGGDNGGVFLRKNGAAYQMVAFDGDGDVESVFTGTPADRVPVILSARTPKEGSSSNVQVSVNGADFDSGSNTISGFSQNGIAQAATIGGRPDSVNNGNALNGYISEIIIYDRRLKDYEIAAVQEYLSDKYAIDLN